MRLCLFEAAIQQVWIFMNGRLLVGIELVTTNDGQQIQLAHQAQNRLEVHAFSGLARIQRRTRRMQ